MRAVRLHGTGDLRVETVPDAPLPGAGEVRLRVAAAGICGSDLHNFRTGQWISRAPSVAGHELSGVVDDVGEGVSHVAKGDLVAVHSRVSCGACRNCREGLPQICESLGFVGEVLDGGFAEHVTLPARLVEKVEPGLDPRLVAMSEPLAVALHALNRLAMPPGAALIVAGCGPIGGFTALVAARGGHPVLVADRNAARASLVAEVTGARVVELDDLPLSDPPLRWAVDATGSPAVIARLVELVAGGGGIALVGIAHGRLDIDPNRIVEKETALIGCHVYRDELGQAVRLLPELSPALLALVDAEIGLDGVPDAYRRLLEGRAERLKTLIRPGAA